VQWYVYWNFHDRLFTLQSPETGSIKDHVPSITLKDVVFLIDEAKRDEARILRRRTFHAGVQGEVVEVEDFVEQDLEITYDFMYWDHFVTLDEKKPVEAADFLRLEVIAKKPRMFARGLTYKVEEAITS
jgi:hypothetical protein